MSHTMEKCITHIFDIIYQKHKIQIKGFSWVWSIPKHEVKIDDSSLVTHQSEFSWKDQRIGSLHSIILNNPKNSSKKGSEISKEPNYQNAPNKNHKRFPNLI